MVAIKRGPRSILDEPALKEWLDLHGFPVANAARIGRAFVQAERAGECLQTSRDGLGKMLEYAEDMIGRHCRDEILKEDQRDFVTLTSVVCEQRECVSAGVDIRPTTKVLLEFDDGARVEAVIIRQKHWSTLCVSSQVGCKMGCTFCATGTMKKATSLKTGQILEQLVHALRIEPDIRNVVFMGMGEPLDNYDAVIAAIRVMVDPRRFGLAPRRICVSTVGIVPKMLRLSQDAPGVNLALSLHAPTQTLRKRIVPTASAYPIDRIMSALDVHLERSRKTRVMIEYIVIKDVNDSLEVGRQLGSLMCANQRRKDGVTINLIPYNPTDVPEDFEPPNDSDVRALQQFLTDEFGLRCYTRREMGQDIAGACGQLVLESKKQKNTNPAAGISDIEDLFSPRSASASESSERPSSSTVIRTDEGVVSRTKPGPPTSILVCAILCIFLAVVLRILS